MFCLDDIVKSLDPRALSLFCRTIAALFSKPEPPSTSSLPPPECVPPNLCSACANRALLVEIPMLLPRVVALLKARDPPRRLVSDWHALAHAHEVLHVVAKAHLYTYT